MARKTDMFKTTSAVSHVHRINLDVEDWACSEKNGRFSRLYRLVIEKSITRRIGLGGTTVPPFEPVLIMCEATWSDVLEFVRAHLADSLVHDQNPLYFSKFGDHCERICREVNALFPSHDLRIWSDGK
jgi:hypothetical protein